MKNSDLENKGDTGRQSIKCLIQDLKEESESQTRLTLKHCQRCPLPPPSIKFYYQISFKNKNKQQQKTNKKLLAQIYIERQKICW